MSRVERGLSPNVSYLFLTVLAAIVGLDLVGKTFVGGQPLREAGQARLLGHFGSLLHPSLGWATEVPLPIGRDQRAWDGMVRGKTWRYGTEGEMAPRDAQALNRRLQLKARDGDVNGVILVVPESRRVREFLAGARPVLGPDFPVPGPRALELLRAGADPGGSSIIVLDLPRTVAPGARNRGH